MPDGSTDLCVADIADPVAEVEIGRKVQFLSRRDGYPEHPSRVQVIETHFSWVFLTDTYAYKLKKPVRGAGFDFRSAAARRRNAMAELRLNRRLARDVYVGAIPLVLRADGGLSIGGPGRLIDWLVKMIRLDANHMFDSRLARRDWHYAELEALAQTLASFFATATRVRLSAPQQNAGIKAELNDTLVAFSRAHAPGLQTIMTPIMRRLVTFMLRRAVLFRRRVRERRLVDGHGDLRPEHVYLKGMPRIIDCLEFRADLRRLDPVNELAYLALECRRLGGPAIEAHLLRRYRERTGDAPPRELVRFYKALNALVRARIAIQHLDEPGTRTPDQWIARAALYLAIAARAARLLVR
jgi:aminoglycoside phosphotransferase family enzyme